MSDHINYKQIAERYRILGEGELIANGDECDACNDGWRDNAKWEPAPPHMIGRKASDPRYPSHTKYRRLIEIAKEQP